MARYSLYVEHKSDINKCFLVDLKTYDSKTNSYKSNEKVDLSVIDRLTTIYTDKNAFLKGYCNITSNFDEYEIKIVYKNNNTTKTLDVAFSPDTLVKNYSNLYASQKFIPKNDSDLIMLTNYLLDISFSSNGVIYRDIMNTPYMNKYIQEKIELYVYSRNSSYDDVNTRRFAKEKLIEELSRYKNIRGLMFFLNKMGKKYTNLNIPVIQNRVSNNFDLPDEIDDAIDPSIETEFNFYDPYQRNYDEVKDDVEIIDIDGGMGKPKQKVKRGPAQVSGQIDFQSLEGDESWKNY